MKNTFLTSPLTSSRCFAPPEAPFSPAKASGRSELLVPAGNLDRLKTAILYGADSVYLGSSMMSLRSKSGFSLDDIKRGAELVKSQGKKFYITCNLFSHNSDVDNLPLFVDFLKEVEPNGVLVADPGIFVYLKKALPEISLHVSTQANICSWLSVDFWAQQGADLCVLAREVSFQELKEIKERCPHVKLEAFVHGAMCMTYSGRCLLSNFMAERGANQGSCAHSCRWNYKVNVKLKDGSLRSLPINNATEEMFDFALEEEFRPGEYYPIEEDGRGSYILNSKDLCLMPVLKEYLDLGVDVLKIEGRHKSEYYVGMVTRTYRRAIDEYYENPTKWDPRKYMSELYSISNRGYTLGFHGGRLTNLAHNYETSKSLSANQFAGVILKREVNQGGVEQITLLVKNYLETGDALEFITPHKIIRLRLYEFTLAKTGEQVAKVSAGSAKSSIVIPLSLFHNENPEDLQALQPFTLVRKINPNKMVYQDLFRYQKHAAAAEAITAENITAAKSEGTCTKKGKAVALEVVTEEAYAFKEAEDSINAQLEEQLRVMELELSEENPSGDESSRKRHVALKRHHQRLESLRTKLATANLNESTRRPSTGDKGCCYRGCNGCMVFWSEAREVSKSELLTTGVSNSRPKLL